MRTLDYYNKNADAYIEKTRFMDVSSLYEDFEECLSPGDRILDLGCGSGRDAKHFLEQGYEVVAVDGSVELCKRAEYYLGIPVRHLMFFDLAFHEEFDGVWACASLLHVPKAEITETLHKVCSSLKVGGVLYASFKYGEDEEAVSLLTITKTICLF